MGIERLNLRFGGIAANFIFGKPMVVEQLTLQQLSQRCQAAHEQYRQTGQSDSQYCFALFQKALGEGDQAAWEAVYQQYHRLVISWVYEHPYFSEVSEEADFFANEAFTRMWEYVGLKGKIDQFQTLGKLLSFLKMCVGTIIVDAHRREKRDSLWRSVAPRDTDGETADVEEQIIQDLLLEDIRALIEAITKNEAEAIVAEQSWRYGLKPNEIAAKYPDHFKNAAEVRQIKANILDRLRRRLDDEID